MLFKFGGNKEFYHVIHNEENVLFEKKNLNLFESIAHNIASICDPNICCNIAYNSSLILN